MTLVQKEIKRVFKGTVQVRPTVFEYSYSFNGKSVSTMQNDGWTLSSTSNVNFNGDGIYCTNWHTYKVSPSWLQEALPTANKITLTNIWKKTSTSWWCDCAWYLYWTNSGTNRWEAWIYANYNFYRFMAWGTNKENYTGTSSLIPNWTYTLTTIADLNAKTIYFSIPWVKTNTYTLTDAEIENIKTCTNAWLQINQSTYSYINNVYIKVE